MWRQYNTPSILVGFQGHVSPKYISAVRFGIVSPKQISAVKYILAVRFGFVNPNTNQPSGKTWLGQSLNSFGLTMLY